MSFNDYPIDHVAVQAAERVKEFRGNAYVQQKWTCKHCRSRQTMEDKNVFHLSGRCEECGGLTLITRCNYLLVVSDGG